MFRIELLPAAHGDSIWIEYGPPQSPTRIVIDGGPAHTYAKGLSERLKVLKQQTAAPHEIDLFVISHIDCDHIDGAIIFLQECKQRGIDVKEVWFNGYLHLDKAPPDTFQPLQGEFLGALLKVDADFRRRWNSSFRPGGTSGATGLEESVIAVADTGPLKSISLPNNATLTLLSPYQKQLTRLRRQWNAAIRGFSPGDEVSALERLAKRREYRPPAVTDVFSAKIYGSDRSAPNASSIAFMLEHANKSCLFAADAHARVLAMSLRRLAIERGKNRVAFDVVKLPHHGSMGNVNDELLAAIDCTNWMISTNGDVFNHPDRETVDLISLSRPEPATFFCNYDEISSRLQPPAGRNWRLASPTAPGQFSGPSGGLCIDIAEPSFIPRNGGGEAESPARPKAKTRAKSQAKRKSKSKIRRKS